MESLIQRAMKMNGNVLDFYELHSKAGRHESAYIFHVPHIGSRPLPNYPDLYSVGVYDALWELHPMERFGHPYMGVCAPKNGELGNPFMAVSIFRGADDTEDLNGLMLAWYAIKNSTDEHRRKYPTEVLELTRIQPTSGALVDLPLLSIGTNLYSLLELYTFRLTMGGRYNKQKG